MSQLTPQQFAQAESLFFQVGQMPQAQRDSFLESACDDPMVRKEVAELLRVSSGGAQLPQLGGQVRAALAPTHENVHALVGRRIGAYEIRSIIGHGGMGVVYLASDTRLGRSVAIKAIPPAYTSSPGRLSRFVREAKILASMSHRSIATVYGLEEADGQNYLVMERVEGKTLSAKLAGGAMPIDQALHVCCEIAQAVQAAHDAGVIHRDLKPGNVMLAPDGRVKVLDFGLARELRSDADVTQISETITGGAQTREGAVLGTPGYMSPEQIRGRPLDQRTDIFSFGCILYECLTGRVAFAGGTEADVMASVLEREPDWTALPARTPHSVARLLRRCTAKDPAQRLRDIGDARLELEEAIEQKAWLSAPAATANPPPRRIWMRLGWVAALVATLALAILVVRDSFRADPSAPAINATPIDAPMARFSLPLPPGKSHNDLPHFRVGLSRDGRKIVVSAPDESGHIYLWIRDRAETSFRKIEETRGGWIPSFSPDGQWIMYFDDYALIRRRLTGGGAVNVIGISSHSGTHHWGRDNMIAYCPFWGRGVARVSPEGGQFEMITTPNFDDNEFGHLSPVSSDDGQFMLYAVWDGATKTRIDAMQLSSRERHTVVQFGSTPQLARTPLGMHLLYERSGTIYAAPIDINTMRLAGPESALVDGVLNDRTLFSAAYAVADDGTLAYIPGPPFTEESRLSWLDLESRQTTPINDDRLSFGEPHLTADGRRLSVILKDDVYKPVIYDLKSNIFAPVLVDGDTNSAAISPDGTMFAYSNNRDGPYTMYVRYLQERREHKLFDQLGDVQNAIIWSPDSRYVAFCFAPSDTQMRNISYVDVTDRSLHAFCDGPSEERSPSFSPDGKWMAFADNQSGAREVYVRSFPDGRQTRQISYGGGNWPRWSPIPADPSQPKHLRLYFNNGDQLFSVEFDSEDGSIINRPTLVYDTPFGQWDTNMPDYATAPDGRILVVELSERGPQVSSIEVILNWWQMLNKQ